MRECDVALFLVTFLNLAIKPFNVKRRSGQSLMTGKKTRSYPSLAYSKLTGMFTNKCTDVYSMSTEAKL